jgi:hypothetical protein
MSQEEGPSLERGCDYSLYRDFRYVVVQAREALTRNVRWPLPRNMS